MPNLVHLADGVAGQAHAHSAPLLGLAGQVVHALLGQPLAGMQDERVLPRARTPGSARMFRPQCEALFTVEVILNYLRR